MFDRRFIESQVRSRELQRQMSMVARDMARQTNAIMVRLNELPDEFTKRRKR